VRKVVKFTPYLILIVGTAVIFAPYLLTPFGKVYSTEGKYVFQLLLLGIIPYSFNEVYRVIKQVDKEMSKILFVTSVGMVTSIGFAYLLLNLYGVIGAPLGIIIGRIIKAVTSYLVDRQTITRFLSPNHPVVG
jgi:Na+-driven multidrug efflux pump